MLCQSTSQASTELAPSASNAL